jgi:large subunit ribosomal protein L25
MKDIQFHPVTDKIVHIDFLQLVDDKEVTLAIPVRTAGNSIGVRNGGRLAINFRTLNVRGIPANIPDSVTVDITELEIGETVRIRDIRTENFTILQADSDVVVTVKRTRAAMAAAAAEDGKKKK